MDKMNTLSNNTSLLLPLTIIGIASFFIFWKLTGSNSQNREKRKNSSNGIQSLSSERRKTLSQSSDENFRGYKKLENGTVTTYFDRQLSPEEKALLGDFTPKRINDISEITSNSPRLISDSTQSNKSARSAWNAAGTWEEKDCSVWAKNTLRTLILSSKYEGPTKVESVRITKVISIEGDAVVTITREKVKYIYDYSLELEWEATFNAGVVVSKGRYTITDVNSDISSLEISASYDAKSFPDKMKEYVRNYVASSKQGLQVVLKAQFETFLNELRAKYH